MKYVFLRCKKQDFILKKSDLFCKKKKKKRFLVYEKPYLLLETNKKDFWRFTFIRQIYYACITKKKIQPKILILSFDFQNLHFYNKEKFSQKKKIISVFNENTD